MNDTVVLKLREPIQLDDLSAILKELVDLQGCTACGFNGWDLNITIDPEVRFGRFVDQFREQVTGVDVLPGLQQAVRR
jgi:hypothetical protein